MFCLDTLCYSVVGVGLAVFVLSAIVWYVFQLLKDNELLRDELEKRREQLFLLDIGRRGFTFLYIRSKISNGLVQGNTSSRYGVSVMDSEFDRIFQIFVENGNVKVEPGGTNVFLLHDGDQPFRPYIGYEVQELHTLYVTISELKQPNIYKYRVNVTTNKENYEAEASHP